MNASNNLLGILSTKPSYGYELKKTYDAFFDSYKSLPYGQVYSTLSRLKRDGKVATLNEENQKSGGPERIKYEITSAGSNDISTWLNTVEEPSSSSQSLLYSKTVISILVGGSAYTYLDKQKMYFIEKMHELTKLKMKTNLTDALIIDNKLLHIDADIKWIDLTTNRLNELKKEIQNEYNHIS